MIPWKTWIVLVFRDLVYLSLVAFCVGFVAFGGVRFAEKASIWFEKRAKLREEKRLRTKTA